MYSVSVLYAVQHNDSEKKIRALCDSFKKIEFKVAKKKAPQVSISDILGADLVILGSENVDPMDSDFSALQLFFTGVNLAGRVAGLLDFDAGSNTDLREALKDTGIDIFDEQLDLSNSDPKKILVWVKRISEEVRDRLGENPL